jgi:uncharacterized protein (TIGR03437 family)
MKTRLFIVVALAYSALAQSAGKFTATGNMTAPRLRHTATLLPDGRVLIAGGDTACYIGFPCLRPDHAELYDPATGTFTATGSLSIEFPDEGGAVLLPDGRVLIAGAGVELYDPSTGEFHTAGKPATLTGVYSTALLNDGRVLLIGDSGAELYDPVSGTFSPVANWLDAATSSFWYPSVLAGGKVLLAPYDSLSGCEIYDPATGTFNLTGALGYFLGVPHRTLLLNGAVLFTGGSDGFGNTNRAKLYDPAAGIFASNGIMSTPRDAHSATLLPDGTVLVAGGAGIQAILASAEIYDPATSGFSATGSLASARQGHTATLLNNGQVLITGGTAFVGGASQTLPAGTPINGMSSAELYTPAVLVPAPELFTLSGDGKRQGAIWHAKTGQIASADSPAVAGEALSMYTTSLAGGSVIPPRVIVGGRLAQVLYYGAAPGYPGYYQVNFVVPDGVPPGTAVSLRLTYIGRSSNAVTVAVQP